MDLTYLGHSCFKVTSDDGATILIDPYTTGGPVKHRPIPDVVDAVLVSHSHHGHNGVFQLQGSPEVLTESDYVGLIEVTAIPCFHDTVHGRRRGPNTAFRLRADGVTICHLGDIGHMPIDEQLVEMVPCDVLLCPVGGMNSLDSEQAASIVRLVNPMVVVPMHYWTPLIGRKLGRLEPFLGRMGNVVPYDGSTVKLSPESIPGDQPTWVLRPLY